MRVGIVGMGYVGRAVSEALLDRYMLSEVCCYDLGLGSTEEINACDIAFVCVPTPSGKDGLLDTSAVEDVLSWLRVPLIVIRSTMPADFWYRKGGLVSPMNWEKCPNAPRRDLDECTRCSPPFPCVEREVVYQPEFICESPFGPWQRERDCKLVLAGGPRAQKVLDFWKPIMGPEVAYIATDWRTAAEVKFAVNCHGAVKAAWWREFLSGCGDADEVRNAVANVPWIERYHTLPIGDGVGGKCFQKDLAHIAATFGGPIAKAALAYMKEGEREPMVR